MLYLESWNNTKRLNKYTELFQLTLVNCFGVTSQHTLEDSVWKWQQDPAWVVLYLAVCTVPCTSCKTQRGQHMRTEPHQNPQKGDWQQYLTAAWHLARIFLSNLPDFCTVNNKVGNNKDNNDTLITAWSLQEQIKQYIIYYLWTL